MPTPTPTSAEMLARMRNDKPVRKGCSYGQWLAEQDASLREALKLASTDPEIHRAAIIRFVSIEGYTGSPSVVGKHLNGVCTCDRTAE